MPALPAVNKVIRVAISGVIQNAAWANILHWAYAGGPLSFADAATLAQDIYTAWATNILPDQHQDVVLDSVKVEDLTSSTSATGEYVHSESGALTGASLPANCAWVLSHKITRRYRGGHPRTYMIGAETSQMANPAQWTTGQTAAWLADWVAFRTAVGSLTLATATPLTFVNVSYKSEGAMRVTPVVDTIIATEVQDRICQQRRRLGPLVVE